MSERLARIKEDRLLRWSAYAAAPYLWLSFALFNPLLLLVPPLLYVTLRKAMDYGIVERHDPVEEPDLF